MLIKSKKLIEYNQSLTDTLILFLLAQFILLTKVYMMVKAITLAAIMFLWFSKQKGRFLVNKTAIVLFIYVIYNVFSTALGVFNGYSAAALRSSTINVIWPAVFLFFINCYFSVERLRKIFKALVWLTLIICVLDSLIIISYIFHVSGIVSVLNKLHLGGSAGTSTLIFFRSDHMYLYAFLSPFMFVTLLLNKNILNQTGMKLRFIKSVAIYASLMAVLSGMGGIWLAFVVGVLIGVYKTNAVKNKKVFLISISAAILIVAVFSVTYLNKGIAYHVVEEIKNHLGQNVSDKSWIIRTNQKAAMIQEWLKSPIIGKGIGGTVIFDKAGTIVEQSQSELSYFVMLYQRGLIGVVLFFLVVAFAVKSLVNRKDVEWITTPFLSGMIPFLVAHAFNPYLSNLSTIWILFFPLLIGNQTVPSFIYRYNVSERI